MKDQVMRLQSLGISAEALHGSLEPEEVDARLQRALNGELKFLYMAPERIRSEMFAARLPRLPLSLLVIDEAHCISQWGYDFRPPYLEIPLIREAHPRIPVMALTASATADVQRDIEDKLAMRNPARFSRSFMRPNLRYFVLKEENVRGKLLDICRRTLGCGIVYARTRRLTEAIAAYLAAGGVSAAAYHGGMPASLRDQRQQEWMTGQSRIICATNAFGMGIDKADVRFVIHLNMPADLESYYQEAGRGGRDGLTALAIAFNNPIDLTEAKRWNETRYPEWAQLQAHYDFLCSHYNIPNSGEVFERREFDISALAKAAECPAPLLYNSIRLLEREGILQLQDEQDDYAVFRLLIAPEAAWDYRQRHPREGRLIEHALRSLGGEIYHYDRRFLPLHWSHQLALPLPELETLLQRMAQQTVIRYVAPQSEPVITFLHPRHRLSRQQLNWPKYEFLRAQADRRFEAMQHYIQQTESCRSLLIQRYFGERDAQPCGRCDVCTGRYKSTLSDRDFDELTRNMIAFIRTHQPQYMEAVNRGPGASPALREASLRYLMDKGIVQATAQGRLNLTE